MTESDLGNREAALERQSYVRHELRGSLAVMYPALSMLLDGSAGELTPKQREYLEILERSAERLERLIAGAVQPPALGSAGDQSLQTLRAALEDLEVLALLGCELPGAAVQKHGQRRVHDGERATQLVPHVALPLARALTVAKVRLSHRRTLSQPSAAGERPVPSVGAARRPHASTSQGSSASESSLRYAPSARMSGSGPPIMVLARSPTENASPGHA